MALILGMAQLYVPGVALAQGASVAVIAAEAELTEVVEEIPLTGTVVATRSSRLSTEISGLIDQLSVELGQRVKQGDEILHLDDELQSLILAASQAQTEQAQQQLADARRRLQDARALGRNQTVSANEIKSLEAEVGIDATVVKRLRAEQRQQALQLQKHRLLAPFDGVISARLVEQGEWVVPGEAVVELVNTDQLLIEFQVPQAVYARLDKLQRLAVRLTALADAWLTARVESIVPVTDRSSRTFLLRAALLERQVKLIPGLSASGLLVLKKADAGVVVDRNALLRHPDGRITVWVIDDDGERSTVAERQVQTGVSFDGKVRVIDGLSAGELVVVEGNEALRGGQAVMVQVR